MVHNLAIIHDMLTHPPRKCASHSSDFTNSHCQNNIVTLFSTQETFFTLDCGNWAFEKEIYMVIFEKQAIFILVNIFRVKCWWHPCVEKCVKTNFYASVLFKHCASKAWFNGLPDSLSFPSPSRSTLHPWGNSDFCFRLKLSPTPSLGTSLPPSCSPVILEP